MLNQAWEDAFQELWNHAAHHRDHRAWVRARWRMRIPGHRNGPVRRRRRRRKAVARDRVAHGIRLGALPAPTYRPAVEDSFAPARPAVEVDGREVGELAEAVQEAAHRLAGGAVLEVQLDLHDPLAGAGGVDVHRRLHPEAGRERQDDGQHGTAQRALPRDGCPELQAAQALRKPQILVCADVSEIPRERAHDRRVRVLELLLGQVRDQRKRVRAGLLATAIFILTILQRVFYGPLNVRWSTLHDLTLRERLALLPPIAIMFALGIYPQLLLGLISSATIRIAQQLR